MNICFYRGTHNADDHVIKYTWLAAYPLNAYGSSKGVFFTGPVGASIHSGNAIFDFIGVIVI